MHFAIRSQVSFIFLTHLTGADKLIRLIGTDKLIFVLIVTIKSSFQRVYGRWESQSIAGPVTRQPISPQHGDFSAWASAEPRARQRLPCIELIGFLSAGPGIDWLYLHSQLPISFSVLPIAFPVLVFHRFSLTVTFQRSSCCLPFPQLEIIGWHWYLIMGTKNYLFTAQSGIQWWKFSGLVLNSGF